MLLTTIRAPRFIEALALSLLVPLVLVLPVSAHGDGSSSAAPVIPSSSTGVEIASLWGLGFWTATAVVLTGAAICSYFLWRRTRISGSRRWVFPLIAIVLLAMTSMPQLSFAGGAASTTTPSTSRSVSYQTDFADGYTAGWFIQPGTSPAGTTYLILDGGSKVFGASANNGVGIIVFYNGGEDWKDVSVTATLKIINSSVFYMNFRDQMIVSNHSRYALQFDLNGGAVTLLKTIEPGIGSPTTTTLGSAHMALTRNTWYTVSIVANGGSLQVSINGATVITANDLTPLLFGTIGFENDDLGGAFRIGSVTVTSTIPSQATWQQLGGPDGGQIQAIDIDPSNTSILYAGAVHTGVLKSDNKGDFWREVGFSNGMTGTKANIVAVAPSNSSIIYASLEDSSTGGGASRSDDKGLHWHALSQGLTGYFVEALTVDPTNPNTIYIATENLAGSTLPVGLEKSSDGGNTWTTLLSAQVQSIAISKSSPNTLYVGTSDKGVMRSDNGGATWRSVSPAQGEPFNRVVIDAQNPNVAIAHQGGLGLAGRTCGELFRTTDGGNTWNVLSGNIPFFGQQPCSSTGGLIDLAQAPTAASTFYAIASYPNGTGVMFRSDDAGGTWRIFNWRILVVPQVVKIDPTDANTVYIGTFGEGVYRSTDGGATVTHATTGLLGGGIYALAVYPGNSNIIYASRSINGAGEYSNDLGTLAKSVDGGVTWTDYPGPPFNIVRIAIDPVTPSTMYVATSGSLGTGTGLWKSVDGGSTWVQKNQGLTYMNLTTVAINPSNTNMILVGTGHRPYGGTSGGGIFKSTDGANTWHKVNIPNYLVNQIVINPSNINIMYAATYGGGMYKSTDAGENWSMMNTGIGSLYVYALAINPSQPDTLYAGVNPFYASPTLPETIVTVFKTTDGGTKWKNVLLDTDVEWILLDPANPNNVYEGDHGGYISWSLDGGSTWSYGTDMIRKLGGHAYMWDAVADPGRDALLVGTCGRGVFINRLAVAETATPVWLKIPYNQRSYSAAFLSNASLSDFTFNQAAPSFVFTVTGNAGSRALTNVTMPTNLLAGPYSVTLDGSAIAPLSTTNLQTKNITQVLVSFALNGKAQLLRVQASSIVVTTTTTTTSQTATSTTQSSSTTSTSSKTSTSSTSLATSTIPTTTSTISTTSSTTSTPTSTTATSATSSTQSSSATTSSTQSTRNSTITPSTQVATSTATSGGGGIPEFPFQLLTVAVFSALLVAFYLLIRSRLGPRPPARRQTP